MSTSISYLRKRLRDIGRLDLLEGAERGEFSFHAAAIDAGLIKQPAVNGNGSQNASKRTAYAIWKATRQSSPLTGPTPSTAPDMPDLAAALAEVEEMRRPSPPVTKPVTEPSVETLREREPTPAVLPEPDAFPAVAAVPCTSCRHPQAAAALREIINTYVAMRRGEPTEAGNVLPRACCQRQLRGHPDVRAMIA
jgi:hypothetical protein